MLSAKDYAEMTPDGVNPVQERLDALDTELQRLSKQGIRFLRPWSYLVSKGFAVADENTRKNVEEILTMKGFELTNKPPEGLIITW